MCLYNYKQQLLLLLHIVVGVQIYEWTHNYLNNNNYYLLLSQRIVVGVKNILIYIHTHAWTHTNT